MTNSISEIQGTDTIFIIGSNTTEAHPVIGSQIKRAVKNGANLIVADPRKIGITEVANIAVQQRPGSDIALINGMMHVIIKEKLHDKAFIREKTEDFEEMKAVVKEYTPEKVEEITGVNQNKIIEMARLYASVDKASIFYAMGITQHVSGTANVLSIANLAMLTGNVGRESTGVNPLRGQNNVQGACDLGGLPNVYPGYQKVVDEKMNEKFKKAWAVDYLSKENGLTVVEMINAAEKGSITGLYIMGENPMISDPDQNHVRKVLEDIEFLVVQDIFLTETAEMADVVLPAACFAEKNGSFTNTERRVQRVNKAVNAPGEAKSDWKIIQEISNRMGYPMAYNSVEEIFEEISEVTPIYAGINHRRIGDLGLQWPCLDTNDPGTQYLHKGEFARGKGKFHPVSYIPPIESVDKRYSFIMMTGRILYQYHTGTMTRNSNAIDNYQPDAYVEMNPQDAIRLGLKTKDRVKIASRRGEIETYVKIDSRISRGEIFMPFHYSESPANRLTNSALDPKAKIPELKVTAVSLEKVK